VHRDIGVDKMRVPFGDSPPVVHTFLLLSVIDGKTMKTIYDTPLMLDPGTLPKRGLAELLNLNQPAVFPGMPLEDFDWQDNWSDMTEAQHQQIEQATKDLLTQSIIYTLSQMAIAN
jgi:hypothetical protein